MKIYTYMKQCADKYAMNIELTAIAGLNCLFRVLSLLVLETDNNVTICQNSTRKTMYLVVLKCVYYFTKLSSAYTHLGLVTLLNIKHSSTLICLVTNISCKHECIVYRWITGEKQ